MSTINPGLGRLLAVCGGVLLIASLFMPWSEVAGRARTGWETVSVWDVFVFITGVCGIAAAVTGGRFGFLITMAPSTSRSSIAMASGASPRYCAQASKSTLVIRIVERF